MEENVYQEVGSHRCQLMKGDSDNLGDIQEVDKFSWGSQYHRKL